MSEAGFDVWTPTETQTRRVPRANVKRRVTLPILPSYLFADGGRVDDLVCLTEALSSPHSSFSLFIRNHRAAIIADDTLEGLRFAERRLTPRAKESAFNPGETVRLTEGGFAGLSGTIEASRGDFAMVAIPGFSMALKIARWHLLRDEAGSCNRWAA